ncbi:hypothetical protein ACGLHS_16850 [Variovorax sp. VaC1]|uniref:hypothetical protein n=1 Tax=Variovorax sp. VaC1 TaxID=3373132 RepID=UPI0037486134
MNGWRQLAGILWPSFLVACGMEVLVFALFDPLNAFCGADALRMSRQGVYTAAFFVFWLMAAASSACTVLLARSPAPRRREAPPRTSS